jgi:hypothetical protein
MKCFLTACFFSLVLVQPGLVLAKESAVGVAVPDQNKEQGTIPAMDSVDALAQSLFTALQINDTSSARTLFFPEAEFVALKDIKDPLTYHKQLLSELDRDVNKLHTQLSAFKDLKYLSWKRGGCKWKAVGTEYNKIAYWSCYRNRIIAESSGGKIEIDLKTLINWGDKWFITHLGKDVKKVK